MTEQLAEVLAITEDPRAIEKLLDYANDDQPTSHSGQEGATLQELYERFLSRKRDRSPATRAQYKRTIPTFISFCEDEGVSIPNKIGVRLVDKYVDALQARHEPDATVLTYTKNVRTWLSWLNDRQLCDEAVVNILSKDELGLSPNARDEALPADKAAPMLEKLRSQRCGAPIHAVLELFWNGGIRLGGGHSADLCDLYPEENELWLGHRPDTGTRLKNGSKEDNTSGDGERYIELKDEVIEALKHFINYERPDVTGEHGRRPLFATEHGRASKATLRRWLYEATSCRWQPDGQEKSNCDGDCDPDSDVCPQSYYPHAIRRGSIVNHLSGGLRQDLASQRFDVSVSVIKKHYDPRTKHQRKKDRAEAVRRSW